MSSLMSAGCRRARSRSRRADRRPQHRTGRQLPKISAARAMKPRPAVMFWSKVWANARDRYAPPAAASIPGQRHRAVANRIDVDPDCVRRARVLTDGSDSQSDRRLEDDDPDNDDEHDAEPDHEIQAGPGRRPGSCRSLGRNVVEEAERRCGMVDRPVGRPLRTVDLQEQVRRQPESEEVDRKPTDDLVGAQADREERVQEPE